MPSLQLLCFFTSIGFLFGCHMNKDSHPTNLYCLAGFTVRRPGQPPPTASSLKPPPLPPPSPLPPTSHLSPPPPLALLPRLHQALREDAPTPTPPQPTTHPHPTTHRQLSIATSIGTVCAIYQARGLGFIVLQA